MTVIYRVEHRETREGPYRDNTQVYSYLINTMNHGWSHQRPSSYKDLGPGKWWFEWPYRHGFSSMEMLCRWFDGCERYLDDSGYVIKRYDVPENRVERGKYQVVFDSSYATEL